MSGSLITFQQKSGRGPVAGPQRLSARRACSMIKALLLSMRIFRRMEWKSALYGTGVNRRKGSCRGTDFLTGRADVMRGGPGNPGAFSRRSARKPRSAQAMP